MEVTYKTDPFKFFPMKRVELAARLKSFASVPLPTSGRPDKSWIDSFTDRYTALQDFWSSFQDLWLQDKQSYNLSVLDFEADTEMLQADAKPEHLRALQIEKAKLLVRIDGTGSVAPRVGSIIQTEWEHKEPEPLLTSIKNKKKRRPDDKPPLPESEEIPFGNLCGL